ncbi:hypothetical protein LS68_003830 [Helicobacter sp. MIT 05-5293]|uniref:Pyridoxamine 5'-phosphate oxidase n=1 Tax=uncultured Helicobacter sp. TaxID=175537 RepID=A0A650ENJ9_9HELI|nr:pyridoxamine 5'-phosphate oxidase family protein [Helicobacter sp. MIT 05-5293]QGT50444.1 pyridoxamine 5'-phosphate oxidase [uncultured Helicobacter sp.]TLD82137.1 hypothetical protein LS68_003830 [Helicobacter sp. MIT 05-5293]
MDMLTLDEISKILDSGTFYLATKGTCGNPRVRPMQSHIVCNNKLYFGTSCDKNLYKHISQFPGVEICISTSDIMLLRIRGEARIVNHTDVKEALLAKYPRVQKIFQNALDTKFAVFYIENISAKLQDYNGNTLTYKE